MYTPSDLIEIEQAMKHLFLESKKQMLQILSTHPLLEIKWVEKNDRLISLEDLNVSLIVPFQELTDLSELRQLKKQMS